MTLTQLSYVLAVAQHKQFALAAEACHVTQPTLSMQIQKLEEELGVPLFDRSKQPIRTTTIGERIVAQARIVLQESQKIPELIRAEKNEVAGKLRLGVIPTLSPYVLPLFLSRFIEHYPKMNIIVEELQTQQIVDQLNSDELDVGLLVTPLHNASLVERALFYEPFLVYLSPKHPLLRSKKVKESDLSTNDVWLLNEGHCFRDQVLSLCRDARRRTPVELNLRFESGSLETLRKMVDQGVGYTLLPLLAAKDIQSEDRKKQLKEFSQPVPTREVSLVYRRSYMKSAIIEALSEEIQKALPADLAKMRKGSFLRVDLPVFEQGS